MFPATRNLLNRGRPPDERQTAQPESARTHVRCVAVWRPGPSRSGLAIRAVSAKPHMLTGGYVQRNRPTRARSPLGGTRDSASRLSPAPRPLQPANAPVPRPMPWCPTLWCNWQHAALSRRSLRVRAPSRSSKTLSENPGLKSMMYAIQHDVAQRQSTPFIRERLLVRVQPS